MSLFDVIVSAVTEVTWGLLERAASFTRKKTKLQQLEEVATWKLGHIGLARDKRVCLTCKHVVPIGLDNGVCPGPPATQQARAKLEALKGKR